MTLTFNPDKYKELLTAYLPKLIKSEAENEQALAIVEDLMHLKELSYSNITFHYQKFAIIFQLQPKL